jgi:hypothetical protein
VVVATAEAAFMVAAFMVVEASAARELALLD